MKVPRVALIAVLSLLAAPAAATAQDAAPPGNAAVDQYRESAPPASSNSRRLSPERRRALAERGRDGAALAAALDRNGGVPVAGGSAGTGPSTGGGIANESGGAPADRSGDGGSSDGGARGSDAKTERNSAGASDGSGVETSSEAEAPGTLDTSATKAAASSTVGPLPVWTMLVGALVVVAAGLLIRRRAAS